MSRRCRLLPLLLWGSHALAQLPSAPELARALLATAPQARQAGLAWQPQGLWLQALRQRSPLVAAHRSGVCQLGYSAYTPGQDYRWLFPALSPAQRSAWLAGMLHHELAHCVEEAAGAADHDAHSREVLADLAFALSLDASEPDGHALVALLAQLRAQRAAADPVHDTSAALRCYLQQRDTPPAGASWFDRLQAWRARCHPTRDPSSAAALAPTVSMAAAAGAEPGPVRPVATAR